jgi:hypothetical protein
MPSRRSCGGSEQKRQARGDEQAFSFRKISSMIAGVTVGKAFPVHQHADAGFQKGEVDAPGWTPLGTILDHHDPNPTFR